MSNALDLFAVMFVTALYTWLFTVAYYEAKRRRKRKG